MLYLPKSLALWILSFLLAIVSYLPYDMGMFGIVRIDFTMVVLFYWFSHNDESCSPFYVLLLGLVLDVLNNNILGTHSIAYLLIYFIIMYAINQKIFVLMAGWYATAIISVLMAFAVLWLSAIISGANYINGSSYIFSAFLTLGVLPLVGFLLKHTLRFM